MADVTPLRQPTIAQRRAIRDLLDDVYDVDAQRYRGSESDRTVAEVLADGILFGWVAEIRESFYGPAVENEEMAQLRADLDTLKADLEVRATTLHATLDAAVAELRAFNEGRHERIADLVRRIEALKAPAPKLRARA